MFCLYTNIDNDIKSNTHKKNVQLERLPDTLNIDTLEYFTIHDYNNRHVTDVYSNDNKDIYINTRGARIGTIHVYQISTKQKQFAINMEIVEVES